MSALPWNYGLGTSLAGSAAYQGLSAANANAAPASPYSGGASEGVNAKAVK